MMTQGDGKTNGRSADATTDGARRASGTAMRQETEHLQAMAADSEYRRQRLQPRPGDAHYLHLADLLLVIETLKTDAALHILDYGAGVSPYAAFFARSVYQRADLSGEAGADYLLAADGSVPAASESFDLILSTQVLEHVENPAAYLGECFRLLKPGGYAVITTHGMFEEHGSPQDFYRWTSEGLRRDLYGQGFEIVEMKKLTTGPRAVLYFVERYLDTMPAYRRRLPGFLQFLIASLTRPFRGWLHRFSDRFYAEHRIISAEAPYQKFYLGLWAYVRRPQ